MSYPFKFPDIGEGVHEGKILQYKVNPGDKISEGDILAVVETDKVVAEIPSPKSGVLKDFPVALGQIIQVGEVLALIDGPDASASNKEKIEENAGVVGELETASNFVLPATGEGVSDHSEEEIGLITKIHHIRATPIARHLARKLGVDLHKIKGTGPQNRVMKNDVLKFKEQTPAKMVEIPASQTKEKNNRVIPLSTLRKTVAQNMTASQQIPAAVIHESTEVSELLHFREELNRNRATHISIQSVVLKALALTLTNHPRLNATFDVEKSEITEYSSIAIGFALESERGLMVPVIREIEKKSIIEIDHEMKLLIEKGKENRISLAELKGGSFSVTNYGAFAGIFGRPMILPPQVAILGLGRIHEAPIVRNGTMIPGKIFPLSLVFDHRVIDGAPASKFFKELLDYLAHPLSMLSNLK